MSDYHDYVFKEGKLVGQFEEMYRDCDMPWHQDRQENRVDVGLAREILKDEQFTRIHDFGCGLGYFLNILERSFPGTVCTGSDVSPTAVERASKLFPQYGFWVEDLTLAPRKRATQDGRSLYVIRATLWYVFPKLENAIDNIANHMSGSDILLVSQNFPPLGAKFVGKEILPNPQAVVQAFSSRFSLLRSVWYEKRTQENDNWFIGVFASTEAAPADCG